MNKTCSTCLKSKPVLQCGVCDCDVCKYCAHILDEEQFSFLKSVPQDLKHSVYCNGCYNDKVAPALTKYEDTMSAAKEVLVFFKHQSKETRLLKRTEKPIQIQNCTDKDETVMRIAFIAAQAGFNAVIDIELTAKKVRDEAYQKMIWQASGIPTQVAESWKVKDKALWNNPN